MQNPTSTPPGPAWLNAYGLFLLSMLAILVIAVAWITGRVDQTTALAVIGGILGGNGLVSTTQWQAAPGLATGLQTLFGQMTSHIQALHQQAITQQATTKQAAAPAPPVPQQQFAASPQSSFYAAPTASVSAQQASAAQQWQSSLPRTSAGG